MSSPGGSPRSPGSSPRSPGSSPTSGSSPRPRGGGGPLQDEDFRATIRRVRRNTKYRIVALAFAALLGLLFVWLHWFGLVVGGTLVGFISPRLRDAVVSGVGFGVLVLAVFFLSLGETAPRVIGMTPIVYVTVAGALFLPAFGSLVRGLDKE